MDADAQECMDDEIWSNWICPNCGHWHFALDDYEEINNEQDERDSDIDDTDFLCLMMQNKFCFLLDKRNIICYTINIIEF